MIVALEEQQAGSALQEIIRAVRRPGDVPAQDLLAALTAVRELREYLDAVEPALIAGARQAGASWAELASALGVASRQAAERRYLRLLPAADASGTQEQRVHAERDRRAGGRAVAAWARQNSADLRGLAGRITALTDLGRAAQADVDRLHEALGGSDAAALLPYLREARVHLRHHPALADEVTAVSDHADRLRRSTEDERAQRRSG